MRYYSVLFISLETGLVYIINIATPCKKKDAQIWAKQQEVKNGYKTIIIAESNQFMNHNFVAKFNLANIKKGGVL